eukprot:jgi/Pico_ML_1/54043/g4472.t1
MVVQELEETLEKKAELDRLEEEPVAGPGIKLIWVPPPEEPTSKAKEIWRAIDRYLPGGYYRMVQQKLRERYGPPMYVYKWKRHYEIADIFPEETDRKGRAMGV